MKNMEVLLREHVRDLGVCGDVVRVAPGYARNYLLPKRLAVPATEDNRRQMTRRAARMAAELAAHEAEVSGTMETLSTLTVHTAHKADEHGHLFGSVTAALIAELCIAAGTAVEEKDVRLETPIKKVGEHAVPVHVHGEHTATITVIVEAGEA